MAEKVIYIMRGLPSSGKSFLSRQLVKRGQIFSTDDYWYIKNGTYEFDITKLGIAHDWNRRRVEKAVEANISPIVIDNTNISIKEVKTYYTAFYNAILKGYSLEIAVPTTKWAFNLEKLVELTKKTHNVPADTIQRMLDKWEDFSVGDVIEQVYIFQKMKNSSF